MARTVIRAISDSRVVVERDDPWTDERVSTEYFRRGRAVCIDDAEGRYPQVCDGLRRTGPTLLTDSSEPLVGLIRREHRRRVRSEARQLRTF